MPVFGCNTVQHIHPSIHALLMGQLGCAAGKHACAVSAHPHMLVLTVCGDCQSLTFTTFLLMPAMSIQLQMGWSLGLHPKAPQTLAPDMCVLLLVVTCCSSRFAWL